MRAILNYNQIVAIFLAINESNDNIHKKMQHPQQLVQSIAIIWNAAHYQ